MQNYKKDLTKQIRVLKFNWFIDIPIKTRCVEKMVYKNIVYS